VCCCSVCCSMLLQCAVAVCCCILQRVRNCVGEKARDMGGVTVWCGSVVLQCEVL